MEEGLPDKSEGKRGKVSRRSPPTFPKLSRAGGYVPRRVLDRERALPERGVSDRVRAEEKGPLLARRDDVLSNRLRSLTRGRCPSGCSPPSGAASRAPEGPLPPRDTPQDYPSGLAEESAPCSRKDLGRIRTPRAGGGGVGGNPRAWWRTRVGREIAFEEEPEVEE